MTAATSRPEWVVGHKEKALRRRMGGEEVEKEGGHVKGAALPRG